MRPVPLAMTCHVMSTTRSAERAKEMDGMSKFIAANSKQQFEVSVGFALAFEDVSVLMPTLSHHHDFWLFLVSPADNSDFPREAWVSKSQSRARGGLARSGEGLKISDSRFQDCLNYSLCARGIVCIQRHQRQSHDMIPSYHAVFPSLVEGF